MSQQQNNHRLELLRKAQEDQDALSAAVRLGEADEELIALADKAIASGNAAMEACSGQGS